MKQFAPLVSYFCEYELYNTLLSNPIQDKNVKDALLDQCTYEFLSEQMAAQKCQKIMELLKSHLVSGPRKESSEAVRQYVANAISIETLFQVLSFKSQSYLREPKQEVNRICTDTSFCVYYPIFSVAREKQQPLLTFSCKLVDDTIKIEKVYANKDIFALVLAQQTGLEIVDARNAYQEKLNEMASAVDALHEADKFSHLYEVVCGEFSRIFDMDLSCFASANGWQRLEKAIISFEPLINALDSPFLDEMSTLQRYVDQNSILPQAMQQYLGQRQCAAKDIREFACDTSHRGSYQNCYAVDEKQWKLVQLVQDTRLLCVEGPPGTGKTTLLKEIIADTFVKKADALVAVWDKEWENLGEAGKYINRSPLGGDNLHSIVISSTNGKAVDNIGLELLQQISYFSQAVERDADVQTEYKGVFCARLGSKENIESFHRSFFAPFCAYLRQNSIEQDAVVAAKAAYLKQRETLRQTDALIQKMLCLRNENELEPFADAGALNEALQSARRTREALARQQATNGKELTACSAQQPQLQQQTQCAQRNLQKHQETLQHSEDRQVVLYADLEAYGKIGPLQRALRFLFPRVRGLLATYGSAEQIRDKIAEEKQRQRQATAAIECEKETLGKLAAQEKARQEKQASLECLAQEISQKSARAQARETKLRDYQSVLVRLSKQMELDSDTLLADSPYQLYNTAYLVGVRNNIFCAAHRLFEVYLLAHKVPILENLALVLQESDYNEGHFYQWCKALYNGDKPYADGRAALVRTLWETFFLCFPVVTTTLHSFRKSVLPLIPDLFDVLMLDESGQVVPYYAIAPLYRARRAVFVGDENQIEPIKNVPPHLLEKKYSDVLGDNLYRRFCIDDTSAQSYAASASEYCETMEDKTSGVILNEHRRCEAAIMAFSNQHIYHNVLNLNCPDKNDKLFGANLVAFDIRGLKTAQHANAAEIDACKEIVRLLVEQDVPVVHSSIGIITPFKQQAEKLRKALPNVEVGTVHTFQGREKDCILFSAVLDEPSAKGGLGKFVGGKGNLLNVAFSRAKKQFIYVGNLRAAATADGIYLRHAESVLRKTGKVLSLFCPQDGAPHPDAQVVQILAGKQNLSTQSEIGRYLKTVIPHYIITRPQLHNEILNKMLELATHSVHLISPWIGKNVVTPQLLESVKQGLEKGVSISVSFGYKATDCSLRNIPQLVKQDSAWSGEGAVEAITALYKVLGDKLKYAPPSHVKLLLVDDTYLFVGSLNWMSNSGKGPQEEISCLVTDADQIQYVKEIYLGKH